MQNQDTTLRAHIAKMLANGLQTQTEPVPENSDEYRVLLAALQELGTDNLEGKLVLAGLIGRPYGADQMRCQQCMYYLVHRKWCALPELALPVASHWWCRLWRI